MESLLGKLLLYLKMMRKRDARQEMRNTGPEDRFRIEGMNLAYRKVVDELEVLLNAQCWK